MKNTNKNHLLSIFISLYLSVLVQISAADNASYVAADKIFLNCGSSLETQDTNGRSWEGDNDSKFAASEENTLTSRAATQDPSVAEVPYMTARIFRSEFTYSFPVGSGRKFVRLYFYPSSYAGLNASNAIFSVTSGRYTLLRNFSVSQTTEALNYAVIVKEFSINVENGRVNVTFTPSPNFTNSYAFVNGIEVVSMPDIYNTADGTTTIVGQGSAIFIIDNTTALEKVVRLNVGGSEISPAEDTGLFRSWSDDSSYIFAAQFGVTDTASPNMSIRYPRRIPPYVAPVNVYATARTMGPDSFVNKNFNLTWGFLVDPGFFYLVRLHFCEIQSIISKINQRVFNIYINNMTAFVAADVIAWAGGNGNNGVPFYKDFVVLVPRGNGQQDLWLELHPNTASKPNYYDAILNGLEIFKVSDTTGNLAGPNPIPAPKKEVINPSLPNSSSSLSIEVILSVPSSKNQVGIIAGGVIGGVAVLFLLCFIVYVVFQRRRRWRQGDSNASDEPLGWLPLSLYGNSHTAGSAKTITTGSYDYALIQQPRLLEDF